MIEKLLCCLKLLAFADKLVCCLKCAAKILICALTVLTVVKSAGLANDLLQKKGKR